MKKLTLIFLFWSAVANAQKIHLILIANTKDASIGKGAEVNMKNLQSFFEQVSQQTAMQLRTYRVFDKNFKKEGVEAALDSAQKYIKKEDLVFFHYSGHGTNAQNGNPYPKFLNLGGDILLSEIYYRFRNKVRLCITIGDCCNRGATYSGQLQRVGFRDENPEAIKANFIKLFKNAKGSMIISGSQPNQASYYNANMGGVVTNKLLNTLDKHISILNPTEINWEDILQEASQNTTSLLAAYNYQQNPQYEGDIDMVYLSDKKNSTSALANLVVLEQNTDNVSTPNHEKVIVVQNNWGWSNVFTEAKKFNKSINYVQLAEYNPNLKKRNRIQKEIYGADSKDKAMIFAEDVIKVPKEGYKPQFYTVPIGVGWDFAFKEITQIDKNLDVEKIKSLNPALQSENGSIVLKKYQKIRIY